MDRPSHTPRRVGAAIALVAIASIIAANAWHDSGNVPQASAAPAEAPVPKASPVGYGEDGQLLRPVGYRKWVHVGTPLTPNDMNGGQAAFPEFHNVYVNPEAFAHYETTGRFPDGTVVVKELISVGTKAATSGKGYFMGDFIGLEVAVKDKARFASEPGNWAYFSFGHEYPLEQRASPQSVANCSACHGANADDDFVFTQYYPVLRAAKGAGSMKSK